MWKDETLLPIAERGALKRMAGGLCVLALGFALLYLGNLYVAHVVARLEGRNFGPLLFGTTFSVLVHGSQVLLLLLAWVAIGRGAGYYFSRASLAVNLAISSLGIWVSWTMPPMLSPNLVYTFPLSPITLILLVILFQLLTLQVENWIDKSAALMLWVYSFQSLELLPEFPADVQALSGLFQNMYRSGEDVVVASMAGTALFLSFMAGAVTSTWLLARYSSRLGQVRLTWERGQAAKVSNDEDGFREVSMVDMRSLVHDLRNPLAAIKGMAFLLREPAAGHEGTEEKAEIVFKAANYMERMIAEILDEDRRHPVLVESFFNDLEKHIRPFPWGEYVAVSIDPGAARLSPALNEMRFMRALLNVLDNAWRANLTAGARNIGLNVRGGSNFLEIEVLDNGPGYVDKGPSYQKSGWGSTGLGLAFARKTIAAHGGSLLLASRADGANGASVLISLPLEASPPEAILPGAVASKTAPSKEVASKTVAPKASPPTAT